MQTTIISAAVLFTEESQFHLERGFPLPFIPKVFVLLPIADFLEMAILDLGLASVLSAAEIIQASSKY